MSLSFVQEAHDYSFPPLVTSFSTASITPSVDNILIAWVESYNGVSMVVSDTLGSLLWTRIGTSFQNGGGNYLDVWWAKATSAVAGTVTFSAGGSPFLYPACQVMEFSGQDLTTPIQAQAQGTGNSNAPQKAATSTGPNTMFVAACGVAGGATLSAGVGWTQPGSGYGGIYAPEAAAGAHTPTFSMTSGTWAVNSFVIAPPAAPASAAQPSVQTFWMG
jgi:hypothetical protein